MKQPHNSLTIGLMILSIILLLALQALWLRNSYEHEWESFRKETNALFRSTIIAMQDSLIIRTMEPVVEGDSAYVRVRRDSTRVEIWSTRDKRDTMRFRPLPPAFGQLPPMRFRDSLTQVRIFVSSTTGGDSLRRLIRPIISEVQRNREPGNFIFRIGSDTLRVSNIQRNYTDTLLGSGIALTPSVKRLAGREWFTTEKEIFTTDPFFMPHTPAYVASFNRVTPYILTRISPQILFSLVLTVLTFSAFAVMYRSIRSQQKLMQLKNDLISNITHELKTPVATVSVALEALQNFKALDDPERTKEYLSMAQHELSRLSLLTDKVLKTAMFEENALVVEKEPVDLLRIVHDVTQSMKLVLERQQATIGMTVNGSDFTVTGSIAHMTNVVYNLLENALKYARQHPVVHITLNETAEAVSISVQDNGIGIPEEYQAKVFEKFFRVPTGDVHNIKGYGLGLSYVASIVKLHGGIIDLTSKPGQGTTFTLHIPRSA